MIPKQCELRVKICSVKSTLKSVKICHSVGTPKRLDTESRLSAMPLDSRFRGNDTVFQLVIGICSDDIATIRAHNGFVCPWNYS